MQLSLCEELANALFVVQFEAADLKAAKLQLLASSPLGAGEIYASVNDYTLDSNLLQGPLTQPFLFKIVGGGCFCSTCSGHHFQWELQTP